MSDSIYVKHSPFGKGVYAKTEIKKGTEIYQFTGNYLTFDQSVALGDDECYSVQVEEKLYLQPDAPGKFINHSCNPNCGLLPGLKLIALEDILPDQELFYDYSTTMLERRWTMKCNCQQPQCRIVIKDFDLIPEDRQHYYLDKNIVQLFIKELIKS